MLPGGAAERHFLQEAIQHAPAKRPCLSLYNPHGAFLEWGVGFYSQYHEKLLALITIQGFSPLWGVEDTEEWLVSWSRSDVLLSVFLPPSCPLSKHTRPLSRTPGSQGARSELSYAERLHPWPCPSRHLFPWPG